MSNTKTHQMDIVTELQSKLQTHIQITAGNQRDMTNRILAVEHQLQIQKSSSPKHRKGAITKCDTVKPSTPQYADEDALERSDSCMEHQKDNKQRDTTHMSGSASSWEGQSTQSGQGNTVLGPSLSPSQNESHTRQCPICKKSFLYFGEAMVHRCSSKTEDMAA